MQSTGIERAWRLRGDKGRRSWLAAQELLLGHRSALAADLTARSDALLRVSRLAGDLGSRCDPPKQHLP